MSYFHCPHCGEAVDIFGRGTSRRLCQKYDLEFLGDLPLDPSIRIGGDDGMPVVVSAPESAAAQKFVEVARTVAGKISVQTMNKAEIPINLFSSPKT